MKHKLLRFSLLSMLAVLCSGGIFAAFRAASDEVVYTFVPQKGQSDYTKVKDQTIDDVTWEVPGNQYQDGALRLGGKSIEAVDRTIIGKTPIDKAVGKLTFTHSGVNSDNLVVNFVKVTVASDAEYKNVIDEVTKSDLSISKNTAGTFDILPTSSDWPANSYYKIAFNVTNKNSSNYAFTLNSIAFYGVAGGGDTPTPTFRDIKADLTQLQALATGSNVYIKVSETGEISQAASAEEANATLKGNWHSNNYGWSNFTASVPVQGCAKITYATHDYGNDIVVTNTAGDEVAKFNTKGPKWENDKVNNVVVAYYRTNEATTLNFSNANYNPYFAVEAIDPGDLPAEVTKYNITFAAGEGAGNAPAALEIEDGQTFKAPKNYFLYAEGKTLTGWNDGTTTYAVGDVITPAADMTLTAQYTANTVALADRTAPVTISYDLSGYNDVGTYSYQGNTGIMVTLPAASLPITAAAGTR